MFRNRMPRYEILSQDAMAMLDKGWRRIVTEIGVEFAKPEALELFRKAGQTVEDEVVSSTPTSCSSRSPRRRASSTSRPATRPTTCTSAATQMAFGAVYGSPFVREGDVRRDAHAWTTSASFAQLAQSFAELDSAGGVICEPNDTPLDSPAPRHDLRAADADRQDLHGQRGLRAERRATRSR